MACSCSNNTDIRGRCDPFNTSESLNCQMRLDSLFWYFDNDSEYKNKQFEILTKFYGFKRACELIGEYVKQHIDEDDVEKTDYDIQFNQAYE